MNILYIHQFFKTPKEPGGTRSYWLAQGLIRKGYNVTMVTANKFQKEKVRYYEVDGIAVVCFSVNYNQAMGILERFKSYFKFSIVSTKYALKNYKSFDVAFATSTPLTVGIPVLLLKWLKKKKYIFEVRDLWPEVPIQMGGINNPLIIKLSRWFEKTIYQNSEHVVALSPGMQDGVTKYIPVEKTSMIPNMSKVNEFFPRAIDIELLKSIGLKNDHLKIIHFGSLGEANGIDAVIDSAALLSNEKIQFLFLGVGATESRLKEKVVKLGLSNILFHPRTPMELTSKIVNLCDISLVSFKDLPILYTNSPNKLFDSLSAGKPILVNSAGWTKDLVEANNLGLYFSPKNPSDLAEKLKYLQENKEILKVMGSNSLKLAKSVYDKSILTKEFVNMFENVFK